MKCIDAEKFNTALLELEASIKPSEKDVKKNSLVSVYWNAISVALHAVRKAAEIASVEVPNEPS